MGKSWRDLCLELKGGDQSWSKGNSKGKGDSWDSWGKNNKGLAKGKGKTQEQWPKGGKGKGKGKDSGKSTAKAAGKGKGQEAWWPCPEVRCAEMMGKVWMNPPSVCSCAQCRTPKETAPAPWEVQREQLRADVLAEGKKAKVAPAKPKPAAATEEEAAWEEEEEEQEEEEEEIIWLTDEFKELEAKLFEPKPFKEGWTPAQEVQGGKDAAGQKAEQLSKEMDLCKKLLELEPMAASLKESSIDFAATRKKLEALEKTAAKGVKDTPGAKLTVCQLETARQTFVDAEEKKQKIALAGAAKAVDTQDRLEEICSEQADAWMDRLRSLEKQKLVRDAAWDLKTAEIDARCTQVLELFDQRIDAARTLAEPMAMRIDTPEPSETAEEKKERLKTEKEEKAAEEKKAKEEKQEKQRQRKMLSEEETKAKKAYAQLNLTATFKKEDFVNLTNSPEPAKEALGPCTKMYLWARASALGDAHLPFSFFEMGATVQVAHDLVGAKVWEAFFGKQEVDVHDVCPMRLRQVVFMQLMAYDACLKGKRQASLEAEMQEALESAQERHEKTKALAEKSRGRSRSRSS